MRILAVSTWFPFPPDNGSKTRAYNLLSWLGKRHTLDLLAMTQDSGDLEYLDRVREFCRKLEIFPEARFCPKSMRSLLGFFTPTPRYFLQHYSREMAHTASEWAGRESYDTVIAVTLGAAPYAADLDIPIKWLDQHNVESQVIKRQLMNTKSLFYRIRYVFTWLKAERFERKLSKCFDVISVVSERERGLMQVVAGKSYTGEIVLVPNGVDTSLCTYNVQEKQVDTLVYTGGVTYRANHDAAARLCQRILPIVTESCPGVRVRITGRTDGANIQDLVVIPGVEFTGYVKDVRPIVAAAAALVVPLRYGGGTKLKVLEAMALGTPVVSTEVGAEGLNVQDGKHILIGESDEDLAAHVVRLLKDQDFATYIAKNARELVREEYGWHRIASDFEQLIRQRCSDLATVN